MGSAREDQYTFSIVRLSVILRMRSTSGRNCIENQTYFLCSITFFRKSCSFWSNVENILEPGRPQMTIWSMRIACWIPKATETQNMLILIVFPLQQLLQMRLNFTFYIHCLSYRSWNGVFRNGFYNQNENFSFIARPIFRANV